MTRSLTRIGTILAITCSIAAALAASSPQHRFGHGKSKSIEVTPIGVYRTLLFDRGGSEIAAYDEKTRRVFTVNLFNARIDVLDISNPAAPFLATTIDVTPWGSQANSVAVHDGIVAVAIEASPKTNPGTVAFFTAYGGFLSALTVGSLPDMVTFTPNGRQVLVANEGEPNSYGLPDSVDPEGTVSVIDLRHGPEHLTQEDVTSVGFAAFNTKELDPTIRIFGPGATVAQDLEPEYIAVSKDSRTAWVTLQENNALAEIDLRWLKVTRLIGLGFKSHLVEGAGLDPNDSDGVNKIGTWPVLGMYQPDGIDAFEHHGDTYLVTANEGDVREWPGLPGGSEARRVSSSAVPLDPVVFPNAGELKGAAALGRLNVTIFGGNTGGDAGFERLLAFGGRSFSILTERGKRIFDSGDFLERLTAEEFPGFFNASNSNNTRDNRSDDKGPEPEGLTIAKLFGRTYLFLGLERIGGIVIYDLDNPREPEFVDYINTRNFTAAVDTPGAEDLGPEGLVVIGAKDSPNGRPLLVVANEISGTTRIYEISQKKK